MPNNASVPNPVMDATTTGYPLPGQVKIGTAPTRPMEAAAANGGKEKPTDGVKNAPTAQQQSGREEPNETTSTKGNGNVSNKMTSTFDNGNKEAKPEEIVLKKKESKPSEASKDEELPTKQDGKSSKRKRRVASKSKGGMESNAATKRGARPKSTAASSKSTPKPTIKKGTTGMQTHEFSFVTLYSL